MAYRSRTAPALSLLVAGVWLLASCQASVDSVVDDVDDVEEEAVEEPEVPLNLMFQLPDSCTDILPSADLESLTSGELDLLRGPGSGSIDTVYPEGPSPQEERGGISCLFGNAEETSIYTISIAPLTQTSRAEVIDGLLALGLNPGQTADGVLTYWILGDDATVPAQYNALYDDAWYEVLIFPGGRLPYEKAEALVQTMREHTTVAS